MYDLSDFKHDDFLSDAPTKEDAQDGEKSPRDLSRRDVRSLIFHLLYAMDAHEYEDSLQSIVDMFNRGFNLSIQPSDEVFTITDAVVRERDALDTMIAPLSQNWRLDRIGLSTKLILRLAIWE